MSSSILQAIWPGEKHERVVEYHNAHGTCPIVWSDFCTRHLGIDRYWWLHNHAAVPNPLFESWKLRSIPKAHRAVLLFTMDNVYVPKRHFRRFGEDLRAYLDSLMISANSSNHWPLIAQRFEMDMNFPALALWGTTVCEDPWLGPYNDEKDEYEPFDWSRAFDLYAELDAAG